MQSKWKTLKKRSDFLSIRHKGVSASRRGVVIQAIAHDKQTIAKNKTVSTHEHHDWTKTTEPLHNTCKGFLSDSDLKTQSNQTVHIGFTATKKIGNAVTRNRAKRRLRALVDTIIIPHGSKNYNYVLIARQDTPHRP